MTAPHTAPFAGRVALVIVAARKLGIAFAGALVEAGACMVMVDLGAPGTAADLVARGLGVHALDIDVSDESAVDRWFAECADAGRPIDILVNNAGLFTSLVPQMVDQVSMAEWDRVMAVNVRGTFLCTRAAARNMRAAGHGEVVNIAFGTVFKGTPFLPHYVASQGAVIALTRSLSRELGPDGIRVNDLAAGLAMTEGVRSNAEISGQTLGPSLATRAISREQTAENVCGAVAFLSGAGSDFATGQTIVVDGRSVMH